MKKIIDTLPILEFIYKNIEVSKNDIEKEFNISASTAHRLLKELEKSSWCDLEKNKIRYSPYRYIRNQSIQDVILKNAIAYMAASTITENDIICLAGGSTTVALIMPFLILYKKNITVISNSVLALQYYLEYFNEAVNNSIEFLSVGGTIQLPYYSFSGEFSDNITNNLHIDKTYLGTEGADVTRGLFVDVLKDNMIERKFMEVSKQNFILISSEKFLKKKLFKWANWSDFDSVITDYDIQLLETTKENFKCVRLDRSNIWKI